MSEISCSEKNNTPEAKEDKDKTRDGIFTITGEKITSPIERAQETRRLGDYRLQEID